MSKVIATIAVTSTPVPAGLVFDHLLVTLTDAAGVVQKRALDASTNLVAEFDNVAPGDGTVTAAAVDASDNPLSPAVSGSFTVAIPQPDTFPLPVSVTLTVS